MFENMIEQVHEKAPLIHNIINYVTANDCANIERASGAHYIMADTPEEAEEVAAGSDVVLINIGTIDPNFVSSAFLAARKANEIGIPVVLDPDWIGKSSYRKETVGNLLNEVKISVIRGNYDEIRDLAGICEKTADLERPTLNPISEDTLPDWVTYAKELSKRTGSVIVMSGAMDIICDEERVYIARNGHASIQKAVGTGSMLSALTAGYVAANPEDTFTAAAAAATVMGVAGERAVETAIANYAGNATLKIDIIDEVYKLNDDQLTTSAKGEMYTAVDQAKNDLLAAAEDLTNAAAELSDTEEIKNATEVLMSAVDKLLED